MTPETRAQRQANRGGLLLAAGFVLHREESFRAIAERAAVAAARNLEAFPMSRRSAYLIAAAVVFVLSFFAFCIVLGILREPGLPR